MSTTYVQPQYATISLYETKRLAKIKASGCCWAVYTVLCGYSRVGKFFAFPSQQTIRDCMDNAYSIRAIQDAILFLEKHGVIRRKSSGTQRKSKTIHLITRKARHLAEKVFASSNSNPRETVGTNKPVQHDTMPENTPTSSGSKPTGYRVRNRNPKGTSIFRKGNFERFDNAPERRYSCDEERYCEAIQAHLVAPTHWEKPEPYKWPERAISWLKSDVLENPTKYSVRAANESAVEAFILQNE